MPPFGGLETDSGDSRPVLAEDEALEVVGEVRQADPGAGPIDPDGADERAHPLLLVGKDVLDVGAHRGPGGVAAGEIPRHRPAGRLLAVDPRDPAETCQPRLVGRRWVRRVRPDAGHQVVAGHQLRQHRSVVAGGIGDGRVLDESPGPVDGHMVLLPEHRDRDRRQLPPGAVRGTLSADLHGPAGIEILLFGPPWPAAPARSAPAGSPACAASFSIRVRRCRGADTSVASTI